MMYTLLLLLDLKVKVKLLHNLVKFKLSNNLQLLYIIIIILIVHKYTLKIYNGGKRRTYALKRISKSRKTSKYKK